MSFKPILFNTEMVRAILDGRKTVTRRVVKPQPVGKLAYCMAGYKHGTWGYPSDDVWKYWGDAYKRDTPIPENERFRHWTPPCHTDDVLWVRETWNRGYIDSSDAELSNEHWFEEYHKRDGSYLDGISGYVYRADFTRAEEYELGTLDEDNKPRPMPWRPSIHMPREATRIWLRVTNVRVERLQEMHAEDSLREGVKLHLGGIVNGDSPLKPFGDLWDSTIKPADREKYGWAANPWVWVIEFEFCEKPEDDDE